MEKGCWKLASIKTFYQTCICDAVATEELCSEVALTYIDNSTVKHIFLLHRLTKLLLSHSLSVPARVLTRFADAHQVFTAYFFFLRKEVIQPHLPIRLPCYDFTPVIGPAFGSSSLSVRSLTSGVTDSHGVTGGVYKTRERIHRGILIRDY